MHFLDLPDDFFIGFLEELIRHVKSRWNETYPDPLLALMQCFNHRLEYKVLNFTPKIHIFADPNGKVKLKFLHRMPRLREIIYNIVPDFFPNTLSRLTLYEHHYYKDMPNRLSVVPVLRKRFESFPPNLTYLKTNLLFSNEFAILPESLIYLEVTNVDYSQGKSIVFNLPNLSDLIVCHPHRYLQSDKIKSLSDITQYLPVSLRKLKFSSYQTERFNFVTVLPELAELHISACNFDQVPNLAFLTGLTELSVTDCKFDKLPSEFKLPSKLEILIIHHCKFDELFDLSHLHKLRKLTMISSNFGNKIDLMTLPRSLTQLDANFYYMQGYSSFGTNAERTTTLLGHLEHLHLLETLDIGVEIKWLDDNIMERMPMHLTKFNFIDKLEDHFDDRMEDCFHCDTGKFECKRINGVWLGKVFVSV
jgi:hypothetical protein